VKLESGDECVASVLIRVSIIDTLALIHATLRSDPTRCSAFHMPTVDKEVLFEHGKSACFDILFRQQREPSLSWVQQSKDRPMRSAV
jgi:hypothetical protein